MEGNVPNNLCVHEADLSFLLPQLLCLLLSSSAPLQLPSPVNPIMGGQLVEVSYPFLWVLSSSLPCFLAVC